MMIYAIGGPTGSGKTTLAINLAKHWNAPVINADAFQMYQGMDIGTNKDRQQLRSIQSYLFDVSSPSTPISVADYQTHARAMIEQLSPTHPRIILVGGTGLYLKATLYDFEFLPHAPTVDLSKFEPWSDEALHDYLKTIDPNTSVTIHPHNRRRVLRAIAIYLQTGSTKSSIEMRQQKKLIYSTTFVGIDLPRDILFQQLDQRVEQMMKQGLIEEVKALISIHDRQSHAFQAIGYKEIIQYLDGQRDLQATIALIQQSTRRYAKRQLTYFRHQFPMRWFASEGEAFATLTNE